MSGLISAILSRFSGRGKQSHADVRKTQQSATGARFEALTGAIHDMEIKQNQYKGKTCLVCGSNIRYKKSRRCVACKHALSVAEWKRVKATRENAD